MAKGFTLLEVLVTMSLISLVILLGAFVYQSFQTYQLRYFKEVDEAYGAMQWLDVFEKDLDQAYLLEVPQSKELRLWSKEMELQKSYEIISDGVVRLVNGQRDTLLSGKILEAFSVENPFTLAIRDSIQVCFRHRIKRHAQIKNYNYEAF
ncbi:MAG: type II secretion system protein [Bacteroidota bacterium]